jgi:hypothetical protein
VIAFAQLLVAIDVDVSLASAKSDPGGLQIRVGLPRGVDDALLDDLEVRRFLRRVPARERRVVIVRGIQDQVLTRDLQLVRHRLDQFVAVKDVGRVHADHRDFGRAVVDHERSGVERVMDAAVSLRGLEREHIFRGSDVHLGSARAQTGHLRRAEGGRSQKTRGGGAVEYRRIFIFRTSLDPIFGYRPLVRAL